MDCPPNLCSEIESIDASKICLDESTWIKLFEEEVTRIYRTLRSIKSVHSLNLDSAQCEPALERIRPIDDGLVGPIHKEIIKRVDPSILHLAVGLYLGISPRLVEFIQICSAIRQVLLKMIRPPAKRRRNIIYRPMFSLASTQLQMAAQPSFDIDLEEACQEGLITSTQFNSLGLTGDIRCRLAFFPANLKIMSSSQPQISLRDHLMKSSLPSQNNSPSGQIFRFHEYYSPSGDSSKLVDTSPIHESELAHSLFMAIYPTSEDFQSSGLSYLSVDVQGQYQLSENPWTGPNVTTSTDLNTVPGVVKEIRAGWARPDRIDSLEVDYVGDFTMSGYICRAILSNSSTGSTDSIQVELEPSSLNRIALEILSRKPELD